MEGTLNSISQPSALPALVNRQRECEGEILNREKEERGINKGNKHGIHLRAAANMKNTLSTAQIRATLSETILVFFSQVKKIIWSLSEDDKHLQEKLSFGVISKMQEDEEEISLQTIVQFFKAVKKDILQGKFVFSKESRT